MRPAVVSFRSANFGVEIELTRTSRARFVLRFRGIGAQIGVEIGAEIEHSQVKTTCAVSEPVLCVFLRRLGKVCVHRAMTEHFHRSTPRVSPSNTAVLCVFLRRLGKVCVHRAMTEHFHRSTPRVSPSNTAQPVPPLPPTPPLPRKPIVYATALARASASFCDPTT